MEPAVSGLGFELVDVQASNGGRLLRLFIDKPGGITVEDCASVSRHLTRVLAVEGIDYERLGSVVAGTRPAAAQGDGFRALCRPQGRSAHAHARRIGTARFVGVLRGAEAGRVQLELDGQTLGLELDDVERARLVPEL